MQALTAIGITQKTGSACGPVNVADSESGLCLDRLPGMGADFFAPDGEYGTCNNPKSYLQRMVNARAEALPMVQEDILRGLAERHRLQDFPYAWNIGQRQGVGAARSNTFTLKTKKLLDASLYITRIGVVGTGEGTATVTLSSAAAMPQDFVIQVEQNGYSYIPVDMELPLDGAEYEFSVTTTGTVSLMNNSTGCGCGQKDTMMYRTFSSEPYAAGISLVATVNCTMKGFLNRVYATSDNVRSVMARMLYYMSGVILCDYILGDVTPQESDTDIDYVKQKRAHLMGEYEQRLLWLMETGIDTQGSHCFACLGARMHSIG